jgi:hypothetical protein
MADDADPEPFDAPAEPGGVIGHRLVGARRVERVVPGDDLQHQRVVAYRAGHRADVIEREGERHDAAAADPAVGRLHPGDAAHRRGVADRAAGIGAERGGEEPGGEAGAAAARRAAGEMVAVPRVARRRPGQVEAGAADRELVGRQLAEQDRAGRFEPLGHGGMAGGGVAGHHLGMGGGGDALDIDDVLQRIGHAVERAAPVAGGDLGLGPARRGERALRHHRDKGVDPAVVALDPPEQRFGILDRRQFPGADQLGRLGEAEIGELGGHAAPPLARKMWAGSCAGACSRGRRCR